MLSASEGVSSIAAFSGAEVELLTSRAADGARLTDAVWMVSAT
jgi:hypothetical protein